MSKKRKATMVVDKPPTKKQLEFLKANFNTMPYHIIRRKLNVTDRHMHAWVHMMHDAERWTRNWSDIDKTTAHSMYMVTLDEYNYLVRFDHPVSHSSIEFAIEPIGCDCTVSRISEYEYRNLCNHLYVWTIKHDDNYVYNFWNTTKIMLDETRRKQDTDSMCELV